MLSDFDAKHLQQPSALACSKSAVTFLWCKKKTIQSRTVSGRSKCRTPGTGKKKKADLPGCAAFRRKIL
jgi:hypothetical protein